MATVVVTDIIGDLLVQQQQESHDQPVTMITSHSNVTVNMMCPLCHRLFPYTDTMKHFTQCLQEVSNEVSSQYVYNIRKHLAFHSYNIDISPLLYVDVCSFYYRTHQLKMLFGYFLNGNGTNEISYM